MRRPRGRVRFLRHWTINTRSDHDALFVHVQVRGRRHGRWCPWRDLLLVSANMGGQFGPADMRLLLDLADATGFGFVVFLQEGGDQPWLPEFADEHDLTYVGGRAPGEASTPMLASGVDVLTARWRQLLGRLKVGAGAGPRVAKAKGMHRTRFQLVDARFGGTSVHQYASQQNRPRLVAALRLAGLLIRVVAPLRVPYFLVGDWNSATGQPLMRWLLAHGLTTNAEQLGRLATHGTRDIDQAAVQRRLTTTTAKEHR